MKEDKKEIYHWFDVVIDFFLKKEPGFGFMIDIRKVVETLKSRESVSGLIKLKQEFENEIIVELHQKDRSELEELLQQSVPTSQDISKKIRSILNRASIANDDEYRLLANFDSLEKAEIEIKNKLLVDYYNTKGEEP